MDSKTRFSRFIGERDVRRQKTTQAQHGRRFTDLRAEETARYLDRKLKQQFGELIGADEERPWPGAFEIVSEQAVATWLHLLESNGLRRFSDQVLVDWFTRGEKILEDENVVFVHPTPIASEPLFRFPPNREDLASLLFRIVSIDPQFLDAQNKPKYKKVPRRYVEAVLNTLNPARIYQIYEDQLPELFIRAGDNAQAFEQLLKYTARKWKERDTPVELEILQQYVSLAFLHEAAHALAMHMPDEVAHDLPAEERKALEAMSIDCYLAIINGDQNLQTSVVFSKNLMKALEKVKDKPPSQETQDSISILIALEMFCDRFSMYLYENYLKIQLYHDALAEKNGYPVTADMMLTLEGARVEDRLDSRHEIRGLPEAERSKLEQDLRNAEQDHVYISAFGDPVITGAERELFRSFLGLLKRHDDENRILRFTMQHSDTSRFVHATLSGLVQEYAPDPEDDPRWAERP